MRALRTITAEEFLARLAPPRNLDRLGRSKGRTRRDARMVAVRRILAGEPLEAIAAEYGRSPHTVRTWLCYDRPSRDHRPTFRVFEGGAA